MAILLIKNLILMIKKVLQKIGASENVIMKQIASIIRLPIRGAQLQLLRFHKDKNVIDLIQRIQKTGGSLMWPSEMIQIYNCVLSTKQLPGDLAEVGVYMGRSARLICEAKGNKTLHLFDTFEGLPKTTLVDDNAISREKMYSANLDSVRTYLSNYDNITYNQGIFPETAIPVKNKTFAFVHLDVDLYQSTFESLSFFYPRMVVGGIILSHDYSTLTSVKDAFTEFFKDKKELVVELSTSQCMVIKGSF